MSAHSVPLHCPYCAGENLHPHGDVHGAWECRECLRAFMGPQAWPFRGDVSRLKGRGAVADRVASAGGGKKQRARHQYRAWICED